MPEVTLLPCPACDSPVKLTGGDEWHNQHEFWIACENRECGCCRVGDTVREECIKRWNAIPRALEWTNELPKVPGWYWYRHKPSLTIAMINVDVEPIEYELLPGQWAGPIPEPREPK